MSILNLMHVHTSWIHLDFNLTTHHLVRALMIPQITISWWQTITRFKEENKLSINSPIPQENNWTNTDCIDNSTPPSINDYNCLSSSSSSYCSHQQPHCKESPFECCDGVTLEDCFVMDVGDQSPVGHCNDISHNSVEFCGELPLPPSVHAGMSSSENKELERKVESSNGNVTETVDLCSFSNATIIK